VEVNFYISVKPLIYTPEEGGIIFAKRPVITGTGGGNCSLRVMKSGSSEVLSDSFFAVLNTWSIKLNCDLSGNTEYSITIEQSKPGYTTRFSSDRTFITTLPVITSPAAGSLQETTFTVGGIEGEVGATVHVLLDHDPDTMPVGKSEVLTGDAWTASVKVEPGPISLVAIQVKGQLESGRSSPVAFKIRPPAFTAVKVEYPTTETSVKFSGTGHTGATVEITVISGPGGTAPPAVTVKGGKWETTATNWPFGMYSLKAIQKVSDNTNGWIESQPYTFTVNRLFPDPYDVTFTTDYQPTFSGKGYTGATVKLYNPGGASKAAPDARVSNGIWSSRASEVWGPTFEREVHIQQTLNGQTSPNWVKLKVTIPPLAPVMNEPVENGLSPQLSGTCLPEATLSLKYSDSPTLHPVVNTNGTWSFRRDLPFEPEKTHNATITQTAAGQISAPTSKTFMVYTPIPKPVITDPEPGSEVGRDVTIEGTDGMAGATMQIRVDGINTVAERLANGGLWYIDLKGLAFGRRILDAQQTLDGPPSERSDPVVVNVVLMPPVFTVPQPGGDLPRISTIFGEGMPGATVEVWLDGSNDFLFRGVSVNTAGRWEGLVTLPVGVTKLRARQAIGSVVSNDSPLLTCNVVPAAPYIETPVKDGHVGRSTVVSGFGVPGDRVTILLGDVVLGSAPVLEDRTWSVATSLSQPGGGHVLVAVASCDGFESDRSAQQPVVLGSYLPVIDSPQAGRWVSDPVSFSGQGRPGTGQLVSWFNPEQPWAPNLPVSAQGWQGVSVRPLLAGGNWCRFQQTIVDGTDTSTISDWSESGRFEILGPPLR
jgi:hypothetical protein